MNVLDADANEVRGEQELALSDEGGRRLLVVDDDEGVREFVQRVFAKINTTCDGASSGREAHVILAADPNAFDAILLDVSMPGESGWEFLARLRAEGNPTPVLFLSGTKGVEARVKGLELGADDFIVKPFDSDELRARVAAVVRRSNALPIVTIGDFQIDLAHRTVHHLSSRLELSPKEFDLLLNLALARGQVRSKVDLLNQVWGSAADPGTKVVEVHISRLRAKLDRFEPDLIETVLGRGYRIRLADEA